ncbi:MAG: glycosyltransferase [Halieaceae bacterium]|nr:glycosyltransferase [Halieaceae bacterium]
MKSLFLRSPKIKPKSPRILVVIGSLTRGGTERHLCRVMPKLNKRSYEIEVFVLGERGEMADQMEKLGVPVSTPWYTLGKKNRLLIFRLIRLLAITTQLWIKILRFRPLILHPFLPESYCLAGLLFHITPVKYLAMSRRSRNFYQSKSKFIRRMESHLHKSVSAFSANSEIVVQDLMSEGVSRDKIRLMYNGIDINEMLLERKGVTIRRELGLGNEDLLLVYVANLIPYKGHVDLFTALSKISGIMPAPWHLLCVGRDDGVGNKLEQILMERDLKKHVHLLGTRTDIYSILSDANLGILVSHQEGFSNAILEYMLSSLPVIATDVGGNSEAVVDGETGLLVSVSNQAELARAILHLSTRPQEAKRMGQSGYDRVCTRFTLDACVKSYVQFYRSLGHS